MIRFKKHPDKTEDILKILHPIVKEWFFSRFKEFSLPQKYGILEVHSRNNVLISAPTGATKTLTAFLSIINELVDSAEKGILEDKIYAVYVSPLRALNYDIEFNLKQPLKEIQELFKKHSKKMQEIRIATRTGDTSASEKSAMLKKPPHILITTPETLSIVLSAKRFREKLNKVDWLIVDEIHALAENKRGTMLSLAIEFLDRLNNYSLTRVGLSATVSPIEEIAKFLVGFNGEQPRNCKIIDVQFIKQLDLKVISPVNDYIYTDYQTQHKALYALLHNIIQEHKTTLIFTNTRASTERVVDTLKTMFPKYYTDNTIAAHHSSLSKDIRLDVEDKLRKGQLKCVVSSTSLELGIDIGYIDIVVLLSSPKSVARALQRCGRSGHQLHSITKGRLVTLDRDDLVECSIILKDAIEKKIDKVHIPRNALDVLSQMIYGFLINESILEDELFKIIRGSYSYHTLKREDFNSVIGYLTGESLSLEESNVYAKLIRFEDNTLKTRGKLSRVLFMTNVGTIPDEARIRVKLGNKVIGYLDEAFLERLRPGDVFVLGGSTYEFRYSRGNTAVVKTSIGRPPTIPSWISEMLPLSFDIALDISKFRRYVNEMLEQKKSKQEILKFIKKYLYVDNNAASAIYTYMYEQFMFSKIPHDKRVIIETFNDGELHYAVFHTIFGRRVNDVMSRAVAFYLYVKNKTKLNIGISDNGFYISSEKKLNLGKPLESLALQDIRKLMEKAIENTEVLKRRFRNCAVRSLMILRSYKGHTKSVSRQQFSSQRLLKYLTENFKDFPILKEAKREVLEDLMDIENAIKVFNDIKDKKITVEQISLPFPSPFATKLVLEGKTDIFRMEDRLKFLKELHQKILVDISRRYKNKKVDIETLKESFSYDEFWKELEEQKEFEQEENRELMKLEFIAIADKIDATADQKRKMIELIDGYNQFDEKFIKWVYDFIQNKASLLSPKLARFLVSRLKEIKP
ncbi:MAG: ATP-dependent helicase Lhr and Lhr-like helicase [Candidatus Woesearchaeota archaeon]|nr:ATP-dependent helicase Lhr and Lhr-like helicase [Candidatus Woesearchaeota archaeon]MDN5327876.1 ATP-dependent helicase Lhr and Lhr-like helicase [Candidatus Woesearchaeota archaeon]